MNPSTALPSCIPCLFLPVFSDATTSSMPDPMQSLHHSFDPNLVCRDLQSESEGWLHNLSIRVHSNALSAGWSRDHTTTLIIRLCTLNGGSMQFYPFHGS